MAVCPFLVFFTKMTCGHLIGLINNKENSDGSGYFCNTKKKYSSGVRLTLEVRGPTLDVRVWRP